MPQPINKFACVVFIDLRKASDIVNHCGLPWSWFKSYLKNRYQFISKNGVKSDLLEAPMAFHKALS